MPRRLIFAILAFIAPVLIGFAFLFVILNKRAQLADYDPRVRHRVTDEMLSRTEQFATQPAPEFTAKATDGKTHSLGELRSNGPVLIEFINHECPCSKDAEPMYAAFGAAYPKLKVVGIVCASEATTKKWATDNRIAHLVLADPDCRIAQSYGARASVYTVVVTPRGKIVKVWPGYSQAMMAEVSSAVADLLGEAPKEIDKRLAPVEMAAGCAFLMK